MNEQNIRASESSPPDHHTLVERGRGSTACCVKCYECHVCSDCSPVETFQNKSTIGNECLTAKVAILFPVWLPR